jgi:hypothetical protein
MMKRQEEFRDRAIASFPFARLECAGSQALETWEGMRRSSRGFPLVIGNDQALVRIAEMLAAVQRSRRSGDILERAASIRHPGDLIQHRASEFAQSLERLRRRLAPVSGNMPDFGASPSPEMTEELIDSMRRESEPQVGEWPVHAPDAPRLSVALDPVSGVPLDRVCIVTLPTDDWTTMPALFGWGDWGACPAPEYHIAAFRCWRDRYGAELVGFGYDRIDLRVRRRPVTREEALALAREHHVYCGNILEHGAGTLSVRAAALLEHDWWTFWWD